jgi:hypothetical protein
MSDDARDFNNEETRAIIKYFFKGKAPTEVHYAEEIAGNHHYGF